MTDWPYDQITDHVTAAQARLTSQYSESTNILALVGIEAGRAQVLEDALWTLLTERWLDDADGDQLDALGVIVGEAREGRPDSEYRSAIESRIFFNRGSGEPETIISFCIFAYGATTVILKEPGDASLVIFIEAPGDFTASSFADLASVKAAAIGPVIVGETNDALALAALDDGESIPTWAGWLSEINNAVTGDGLAVELHEVVI